jgi:hypothetical protein
MPSVMKASPAMGCRTAPITQAGHRFGDRGQHHRDAQRQDRAVGHSQKRVLVGRSRFRIDHGRFS